MEEYNPDFENKPEKGFWKEQALVRVREMLKNINEDITVTPAVLIETTPKGEVIEYDTLKLHDTKHKDIFPGIVVFDPSQEYVENYLDEEVLSTYRVLVERMQMKYN